MRLSAPGRPQHGAPTGLLLLGLLAFFWGLSWSTIKIVIDEMPVMALRTLCCVVGGPGMLLIAWLAGERIRLPRREILPLGLVALLNVTLWQVLMAFGLTLLPASKASIICYTMPAFATLFGWLILHERLGLPRLLGLALSLAGLAVLVAPNLGQLRASPLGVLLILAAAASWAGGTVGMKYFRWSLSTMQSVGWQFVLGGIPIALLAAATGTLPNPFLLSPEATLCLLYTLAIPVLFCQWAWFKVVEILPGSIAAMGTLAIPVVGALSGALLLHETLGVPEFLSLGLVVAGLAVLLLRPAAVEN